VSTLVVFSCDQKYFPLAKGLVLSLKTAGLAQSGIGVAFIDIGCNPQSLKWFSDSCIRVLPLSALMEIEAMRDVSGYHLAQVCRAYLPTLFPDARCFIWLDSDLWVQIGDTIKLLASWAIANHERLFICPEWHYSYETFNNDVLKFHVRNVGAYYVAAYGEDVAAKMSVRPFLNTGVFAMAAENPLWGLWAADMKTLFARQYSEDAHLSRHMADGLSLTRLAAETSRGVMVDPLFNFACIWALPFRDNMGVVRVPLPPHAPIGIVHLSMWAGRRRFYFEHRLLFQEGRYLTDEEQNLLLS